MIEGVGARPRPLLPRARALAPSKALLPGGLALLAWALGMAAAFDLRVGLVLLVGAFIVIAVALNPSAVESSLVVVLVAGAMVLTYGFSNLGVQTGIFPIPLTEMLLVVLVAIAAVDARFSPGERILVPLFLFAGLVGIRLVLDIGQYRTFAVRDSTTAIEAFLRDPDVAD